MSALIEESFKTMAWLLSYCKEDPVKLNNLGKVKKQVNNRVNPGQNSSLLLVCSSAKEDQDFEGLEINTFSWSSLRKRIQNDLKKLDMKVTTCIGWEKKIRNYKFLKSCKYHKHHKIQEKNPQYLIGSSYRNNLMIIFSIQRLETQTSLLLVWLVKINCTLLRLYNIISALRLTFDNTK